MKRAVLLMAAAVSCLALAGCGRPHTGAEIDRLREGVAAYREGDHARLVELIQVAGTGEDAAKACSKKAYADSREATAAAMLEQINLDALFSMSEEARFAFLTENPMRTVSDLPRPLGCYDASSWTKLRDASARRALYATFAEEEAIWRKDLETRYGEQELAQRLDVATTGLQVNNVGRYAVSSNAMRAIPARWR